jgi:hypothetical protein
MTDVKGKQAVEKLTRIPSTRLRTSGSNLKQLKEKPCMLQLVEAWKSFQQPVKMRPDSPVPIGVKLGDGAYARRLTEPGHERGLS